MITEIQIRMNDYRNYYGEENSSCFPNLNQVTYLKAIKSSFELAGISFPGLLADSEEAKGFFKRSILTFYNYF